MNRLLDTVRDHWVGEAFAACRVALFGEGATADDVATWITTWCDRFLGAGVASTWLWHTSVAWVLGVRLADREPVVLRFGVPDHSNITFAHVQGVVELRKLAAARGVPAPPVLVDPQPVGGGWVMAEAALLDGRPPDPVCALEGSTLARGWMELSEALADAVGSLISQRSTARVLGGLYTKPHSPLLDFEATTEGAEWIDELAAVTNAVIRQAAAERTAAHGDWRPDNLRVDHQGRRVVAIYDWEAMEHRPVTVGLGSAASQFTLTSIGGSPRLPTAEECLAFAAEAERVRRRPFTESEWHEIRSSIVQAWCYSARCEHALAVRNGLPPGTETPAAARLRSCAPVLLRL